MSRSLNKVQLIGRLGGDPQMRYTSSGTAVTSFSIATNRQWQGKDGNLQEETDWHSIVAWDKLAQICSEHLTKGRLVYIEGRLQTRSWEQDGQTRYKTEIVANDMLILDTRGTGYSDVAVAEEPEAVAAAVTQPARRSAPAQGTAAAPALSRTSPARTAPSRGRQVIDEDDPEDLPF